MLSEQRKRKLKNLYHEKEASEEVSKASRRMTKTKIKQLNKELQSLQRIEDKIITGKFRKREKTSGKNARRKLFKQTEINTINHKLLTIQQKYENNQKKVTKVQHGVKRMNKKREVERKMLSVEIDSNTKKIKSIETDKTEPEKQYINHKSINLKLEIKTGSKDQERTTEAYTK